MDEAMRLRFYVLDEDRNVVEVPEDEWVRWTIANKYEQPVVDGFFTGPCRVGVTEVVPGVSVSTVFLTHDESFRGTPIVFETMVWGGALDQEQERYSTWAQAEAGHARWVKTVEGAERPAS